jgi:hypothetical protein
MVLFEQNLMLGDAVARLHDDIIALRENWIGHPDGIKTLGFPTYKRTVALPGPDGVAQENLFLWHHFGYLYLALQSSLARLVQGAVCFDFFIPLPGFHIFESPTKRYYQPAPSHLDKSFLSLDRLASCKDVPADHLSALVSICVPASGCSTDFFLDVPNEQITAIDSGELPPSFQAQHEAGKLIVFSSHVRHRISAFELHGHGDYRITFQVHMARRSNAWIVYW